MFKLIDWVILVVLVSFAILIGFIAKFQKWRVKWHERCEKKRKLARRIDLDPDGEFALDVTETALIAAAAAAANQQHRDSRIVNLTEMSSPSSTLLGTGVNIKNASLSSSSGAGAAAMRTLSAAAAADAAAAPHRPSFFMNAISLVIGFQTTTSIVGLPLEFYFYGAYSYQFALCMFIAPLLIAYFFVPFLYKIKSASIYDYLDDKFGHGSRNVKNFTLLLSILFQFTFASLVLFSTSIACMQIVSTSSTTPISPLKVEIWMISIILGTLSASLALMGLRSVVLANFFQYLIMVACNLLIIVLGIRNFSPKSIQSGPISAQNQTAENWSKSSFFVNLHYMWNITKLSGRGEFFIFDENFRTRYTFWNGLIGLMFNTLPSYCLTQQSYMRIKQAKSMRSARLLVLSIAPIGFFNLVLILTLGLVMSAYFELCSTDGTNVHRSSRAGPAEVAHVNQLFTRFLAQFYSNYQGLFGLFIALLVSSAIGTLSSVLKALSVVLSQEMLRSNQKSVSSRTATSFSYAAEANYDAGMGMANGPTSDLSRNASFARPQHVRNSSRPTTTVGMSGADAASDIDNLYEEHLVSIQIAKMSRKHKERVLKKFLNKREKGARYFSKKVVSILIVVCSILIILASVGLNYVPGSLTSVAFSLMNAIHGPVLFIYLCARFNDYSLKRHKYAMHRSTISKLRNFQFIARDVIASCVLAILVVETLFIGRLVTSAQSTEAKNFFNGARVSTPHHVFYYNTTDYCPSNFDTTSTINQSNSTQQRGTIATTKFNEIFLTSHQFESSPSSSSSSSSSVINIYYYFFAISFNWYPFIGFFLCCLSLAVFNFSRLILRMALSICLALKCWRKCC